MAKKKTILHKVSRKPIAYFPKFVIVIASIVILLGAFSLINNIASTRSRVLGVSNSTTPVCSAGYLIKIHASAGYCVYRNLENYQKSCDVLNTSGIAHLLGHNVRFVP